MDAAEATGISATPASTTPANEVLQRFDTDNPYLQRLFGHELFGVIPAGCGALLQGLGTVAPDEQLVSAMKVRHGLQQGGILMITTHWLRYVKQGRVFTVVANDEFWPLDGAFELEANLGSRPLFRTPDGSQFQVFPTIPVVSRRQAKGFLEIYKVTVLAGAHLNAQIENAALEGMATTGGSGTAAEIKELAALHDSGALSDEEFATAKARLLES